MVDLDAATARLLLSSQRCRRGDRLLICKLLLAARIIKLTRSVQRVISAVGVLRRSDDVNRRHAVRVPSLFGPDVVP
jgi:hypothetical protein